MMALAMGVRVIIVVRTDEDPLLLLFSTTTPYGRGIAPGIDRDRETQRPCGGVREAGHGQLGHLAAERARHQIGHHLGVGLIVLGQRGQQVRELGQGRLGRQVVAEDDAGLAEREPGGVQRRDEPVRALADVDDGDALLDGGADDGQQGGPVGGRRRRRRRRRRRDGRRRVAHPERLDDEAPQVRHPQDVPDHLGLDAREDAHARHVRRVEVLGADGEAREPRRASDELPVHLDAEPRHLGERAAVGRRERLERRRRDLRRAVPAEQRVVEEEAHFRDHERPRDD